MGIMREMKRARKIQESLVRNTLNLCVYILQREGRVSSRVREDALGYIRECRKIFRLSDTNVLWDQILFLMETLESPEAEKIVEGLEIIEELSGRLGIDLQMRVRK